jgi:hypothetical protein
MGETEIIKMLNLALDEFVIQTRMIKDVATIATTTDQRYYDFDDSSSISDSDDVLEVFRVEYDTSGGFGKKIPRLLEPPSEAEVD